MMPTCPTVSSSVGLELPEHALSRLVTVIDAFIELSAVSAFHPSAFSRNTVGSAIAYFQTLGSTGFHSGLSRTTRGTYDLARNLNATAMQVRG